MFSPEPARKVSSHSTVGPTQVSELRATVKLLSVAVKLRAVTAAVESAAVEESVRVVVAVVVVHLGNKRRRNHSSHCSLVDLVTSAAVAVVEKLPPT